MDAVPPAQHFRAGVEHYRARRYREAIRELELAAAEVPSAELWFDLGRAHEELGETELAIASYERYLRDRVDAPDAVEVQRRIGDLKQRAPARGASGERPVHATTLAIAAPDPGVTLELDGRSLGRGPIDRMFEVDPGRHDLRADLAGRVPLRAEPDLMPGALSAAYVDLRPLSRPAPARRSRPLTWTSAGFCAASVLATGSFGWLALSARERGDLAAGRGWTAASDVALGSAVGFAITATILYFVEGRRSSAGAGANVCDPAQGNCGDRPLASATSRSLDPFEAAMISPRSTEISAAGSNSVDSAPTR
ncbi:MAG: tol-pal system YbgF family protein [Polyangiales bacterium]